MRAKLGVGQKKYTAALMAAILITGLLAGCGTEEPRLSVRTVASVQLRLAAPIEREAARGHEAETAASPGWKHAEGGASMDAKRSAAGGLAAVAGQSVSAGQSGSETGAVTWQVALAKKSANGARTAAGRAVSAVKTANSAGAAAGEAVSAEKPADGSGAAAGRPDDGAGSAAGQGASAEKAAEGSGAVNGKEAGAAAKTNPAGSQATGADAKTNTASEKKPSDTSKVDSAEGVPKPANGAGTSSASKAESAAKQPPVKPAALDLPTEPAAAYSVKKGAKLVALTFDDGPDDRFTPAILDILKAKKIRATFFTVGLQVKRHAKVMQRISREGSEIGNHSYAHKNLTKLDSGKIVEQIKWTDMLIDKQIGYVPRLVRAPYGAVSPQLKDIVKQNHRELIGWTVDTRDWEGSSVSQMRANVSKNTRNGGIILMHSFGNKYVNNTVQLLPLIIEDLQSKGYTFVTVSELLAAKSSGKPAAKNK
ncbi:polysaccharide deacetylase family protein [Paenibacillus montanisoli]|uniref:NodB homology domain-containing protein n=1 Tax=Paenibacillus montanisoli TaxID=2081970 RepID=A0A328TXI1_9BACL|nr:polysaccharide deacetylase family protein [Paenibacillus montanisoli]RAP74402.1 hypothetical protein DL346_20200 [Paenibacillus montanisoli]